MVKSFRDLVGKVMTVRGPIEPEQIGAALMHDHLYGDGLAKEEKAIAPERMELLMKHAVPSLKRLNDFGCHSMVDPTVAPGRATPDVYLKVSELAKINIILATGFYREVDIGTYWVKTEDDAIWPFARHNPVEKLVEFMLDEFEHGIHGSDVHPGLIKLGCTRDEMTPTELKTFKAGARAQKQTGVHITTHCDYRYGSHGPKVQLDVFEKEGVNPRRVVQGHTASNIVEWPRETRECMKRGATFCPTNLRMDDDWEKIEKLVNAIRGLFQEGYGDHLVLSLDYGFANEGVPDIFMPCNFMPPPPYVYMFDYVLPRFRKLGLEEEAIQQMMVANPKRIIPIQEV